MEALKANELRIGNWISNGAMPITAGFDQIRYAEIFQPIPLTEDWLIRAGLENDEITWSIKILLTTDEIAVLMLSKTKVGYAVSLNFITNQIANVEYVHLLQNLIHALTNTELTLKN